jgi:serine phosphatase RsbU (regulator of sigma subunit)/anti-sigma regulatory factor (Ser/Thr protein kinase)
VQLSERGKRLRSRLIAWAAVPAVLVLAAAAIVTFAAYNRVVEEEVVARELERASLAASRLEEEMAKYSSELLDLARDEAKYQAYPLGQLAVLRSTRGRLAVFDGGVVLLDHLGTVMGSVPDRPEIVGQDWSGRPYVPDLLAGRPLVFSNASTDGPGDTPVVSIAVPVLSVYSQHRKQIATLVGMFRLGEPTLSAFYASIVRLRLGDSAYLIDGQGTVIYHPDASQVGRDMSGDPIVQRLRATAPRAARVKESDRPGGDIVAALAPVPGTSWALITEHQWAAVANTSRSYGRFLFGLLVLGIVLPTIGFGLLAHVRRGEALERAQIEQQLAVARHIQETLLPAQAPDLPGWRLSGHYQPAQAVGGDFYDYMPLPDGRIALIIGDVTDKGVPAALVMASTRSLLRSIGRRVDSPGAVLAQVNELLRTEIPSKMFVTCLYAILDPATGRLVYANAGHNLPYRALPNNGGAAELWARGMPLGLMPGMVYEEKETLLAPGECLLLYSDGLVEAHNPKREMFGNPLLQRLMGDGAGNCPDLIVRLLAELEMFTGRGWEQEDDVTLVTLQHTATPPDGSGPDTTDGTARRLLDRFSVMSRPGGEREAMERVVQVARALNLPADQVDRLRTAVAESVLNAIEHGNRYQPDLPVDVDVLASSRDVVVRVTDRGDGPPPPTRRQVPDLAAKIAGNQSPRGWGLFLIENMVDEVNEIRGEGLHTVELVMVREGGNDGVASPPADEPA